MPKEQNLLATEQITISTTPPIIKRLETLVKTGYYGKNVAEAAERLLARLLEDRFAAEKISSQNPT
jgi:Arc/MetJ-type ribon-helix-helix transcriptional regulator